MTTGGQVTLTHFDLDQILENTVELSSLCVANFINHVGQVEAQSNIYLDFLPEHNSVQVEMVIASSQGNVSENFIHELMPGSFNV